MGHILTAAATLTILILLSCEPGRSDKGLKMDSWREFRQSAVRTKEGYGVGGLTPDSVITTRFWAEG